MRYRLAPLSGRCMYCLHATPQACVGCAHSVCAQCEQRHESEFVHKTYEG